MRKKIRRKTSQRSGAQSPAPSSRPGKWLLTVLILLCLLAMGSLGFRHFVTDRITDRGGMENPDYTGSDSAPMDSREPSTLYQ